MTNSSPVPLVSFVVPLFNTGEGLRPLLDAFKDLPIPGGYEVVFVNDASPDGTGRRLAELLQSLPYDAVLVEMAKNFGEHAAVLEGYRNAKGEIIINLDDDLQNPVSEALKIAERLQSADDDVVYTRFDGKKHSLWRNFGSWFTNRMASFLLGKPRDLYFSSFRGLRRCVAERVSSYRGPFPYIDGLIFCCTDRISVIDVQHDPRKHGRSGYNLGKLCSLWMNMFFNFSIVPMRLVGLLGILVCAVSILMVIVAFGEYVVYGSSFPGWSSLMAATAFFSGATLLMLSFIGEYVGRSYLTLSQMPQSVIRSVHRHEARRGVSP
jgi:glycosyltransferase involved in cell wall biosynthesis